MIRIPSIPQLQSTGTSFTPVDPSAKIRQLQALGDLGQGIASLGEHFHDVAIQAQNMDDKQKLSGARNAWAEEFQKHSQSLDGKDPTQWGQLTNDFLAQQKEKLGALKLSDRAMKEAEIYFDDYAHSAKMNITDGSVKKVRDHLNSNTNIEFSRAVEAGDESGARRAIHDRVSGNLNTPEEGEEMMRQFHVKQEDNHVRAEIHADPVKYLDTTSKPPANSAEIDQWERRREYARVVYRQEFTDTSEKVNDAIFSGKITKPEDIDKIAANLRPAAVQELKNTYQRWQDSKTSLYHQTEEYQHKIAGEVSNLLDTYNPAGDGYDAGYLKIEGKIREIPENSAIRSDLEKRLKDIHDGAQRQATTLTEIAQEQIDQAFPIPEAPQSWSTGKAIDDGLLLDTAKLKLAGWTESQAKEISTQSSNEERVMKLKELWEKRGQASPEITEDTVHALQAIKRGESEIKPSSKVTGQFTKAKMEVIRNRGRAKIELAKWARANPNASEADLNRRVKELALAGDIDKTKQDHFASPPRSSLLGKVFTSTDRGNAAAAALSRISAGDDHPFTGNDGTLAVSGDIRDLFENHEPEIKPGSLIKLQLSNGKTIKTRWNGATSQGGEGRRSTGVFDIMTPNGSSPHDGVSVVDYSPVTE